MCLFIFLFTYSTNLLIKIKTRCSSEGLKTSAMCDKHRAELSVSTERRMPAKPAQLTVFEMSNICSNFFLLFLLICVIWKHAHRVSISLIVIFIFLFLSVCHNLDNTFYTWSYYSLFAEL